MKKELREIIAIEELTILSERKAKDGSMTISAPWIRAGVKNKNGRLYSLSLLEREVAKTQKRIEAGSAIGSADHPLGAHTTLGDASHIITKLSIDKDGRGMMEAKILPTSKGKNVIEIINAGGELGISARGAGSISPSGIVGDDYTLLGIDFCTSPSEPTAVFNKSNVFESQNFEEEEIEEEDDREQVMYTLLSASYGMALNQGFTGDFDLYCTLHEKGLREVMALPANDRVPTQIIADIEEAIRDRTYGYYLEAQSAGYKGTYEEWKEKFPQLVESAGEKAEPKAPEKSSATWGEIRESGYRGSQDEYKKEFPNITILLPKAPEKVIVESLEAEAKRIYEGLKKDNPNSSLQLEDVRNMLFKEGEGKRARKERELAAFRVSRSLAGSGSALPQAVLEKMVQEEIESIKEQKAEKKRKNWEAYKRLLSD